MTTRIKNLLSRFSRDEKGDITVEVLILLPALLVIFAASWVYFDVMRQQTINQKANYTIGDIVSRETEILDESYIDNAQNLLLHLAQAQGDDVDLRITIVQYNVNGNGNGKDSNNSGNDNGNNNGSYDLVWSKARGDWPELTQADIDASVAQLPLLAPGDQTILVETRDWYNPLLNLTPLDAFDISTYSFTRPRFAPQVIFEGINDGSDKTWQNNGWGNGDDDAPGGSLCTNNAENADEGDKSADCSGTTTTSNGKGKQSSA
ncbi:TadE/TadG family type IV pilus assembly protein [Marivita geojedonensis]|uniref:TadE/TadG family type IV pilus assembly protein n=1 Tax=Marivita geojedonensis TaxID=1123756 RepID=UPI000A1F131D|nr:hypothetical protein [Marivita geojedonensis]PRY74468.1 hypothetical protein CLV76_12070 [Marivita geojedonensis]